MINATVGWINYYERRYDEAAAQLRKTLEMDSTFPTAHWLLGYTLQAQSKYDEAIAQFQEARSKDGTPAVLSALGHALAVSGRCEEAAGIVAELDRMSLQRYVPPESQGVIFAGMADYDRAFEWLNKAIQERSSYMIYLAVDPRLDPMRPDPRFAQLLHKTNARATQ
jgi:adenylate cyclase